MKLFATLLFTALAGTVSAQQYDFTRKPMHNVEPAADNANPSGIERFNIRGQVTYVYQYKPANPASYSGINSLPSTEESENTLTATLYAGLRLWKGAEVYVNPELAGGSGIGGALGMGGASNGESFRVGNPHPVLYLARGYFRQTFSLRNKRARKLGYVNSVELEGDANELAGYEPKDYLRFYVGKLSLGDLYDNNDYSNNARTQFMNWALMNNGAWDYAANTRGYTYNFTTELQLGKFNVKAGVAALPDVANGPDLSTDFSESLEALGEISKTIKINKRPGKIALLGFYNRTHMGSYAQASQMATPYLRATQTAGRQKYGFGFNMQQELSDMFGAFVRLGWNDGKTETWCFTEIDQTATIGLSANGHKWKRPQDNFGVSLIANGISEDHRNFLAKGGYGFMLGDGKLNYANEFISEVYYSFKPLKKDLWFTADYQFCMNPGYNADRGPVHIFALRAHVQF